jgi:hypothetical protein
MALQAKLRTYEEWNAIRFRGRSGVKKIRRDTVLAVRDDGTLTFTYVGYSGKEKELLVTLAEDNTYTLHWQGQRYYPTYSNIYHLVAYVSTNRDVSHYKHYRQPVRIHNGHWQRNADALPLTDGMQFRDGKCINPEVAVDYKRTLNREKSLPWLRKTVVLAKVLRVATRMQLLERDKAKHVTFDEVNIEDPTAADAEIILRMGNAEGLSPFSWRSRTPEAKQAAMVRAAENGLADFREWLYLKHECYEWLPIVLSNDQPEGEQQCT